MLSAKLRVNGRLLVVQPGGVKNCTWISDCAGGQHPNPHVVQGSPVLKVSYYRADTALSLL